MRKNRPLRSTCVSQRGGRLDEPAPIATSLAFAVSLLWPCRQPFYLLGLVLIDDSVRQQRRDDLEDVPLEDPSWRGSPSPGTPLFPPIETAGPNGPALMANDVTVCGKPKQSSDDDVRMNAAVLTIRPIGGLNSASLVRSGPRSRRYRRSDRPAEGIALELLRQ